MIASLILATLNATFLLAVFAIIEVINSRNVAFKVAKMREAIMEDQDQFLMRNSGHTEVGLETNN